MAHDTPSAVPNSVRAPSRQCVEFIPARTVGCYRAGVCGDDTGDPLDFAVADSSFGAYLDNAALRADQRIRANDVVVLHNLGIPGADAYAGGSSATVGSVTAGTESVIAISARQFAWASDNKRFQVIAGDAKIVSFACSGDRLLRSSSHAYGNSYPTCPTPPAAFEIDGFKVAVSCAVSRYDEAGAPTVRLFRIDAMAIAGGAVGSLSYVERSESVTIAYWSLATQYGSATACVVTLPTTDWGSGSTPCAGLGSGMRRTRGSTAWSTRVRRAGARHEVRPWGSSAVPVARTWPHSRTGSKLWG